MASSGNKISENGPLKIEQVARLTGLTKRTIRYYEDLGVLSPPERSEKGTRHYSMDHVEILNRIIQVREAMGYSLPEIQKYISLSRTLDAYRIDCKNFSDQKKRKIKLNEIIEVIDEQLNLISLRIEKIKNTEKDLLSLKKRAKDAISKMGN